MPAVAVAAPPLPAAARAVSYWPTTLAAGPPSTADYAVAELEAFCVSRDFLFEGLTGLADSTAGSAATDGAGSGIIGGSVTFGETGSH
jgi:hypothetical protein